MSVGTDTQRIDVNLSSLELDQDIPAEVPDRASIEISYGDPETTSRTVTVIHGQEEWTLEFENGRCVAQDPAGRDVPKWMQKALERVQGELR